VWCGVVWCGVVAGGFDFYASVNYLNNIKFKINKLMLFIVLEEWNKEDSKLFKGLNRALDVLDNDTKDIKLMKSIHNSKHILYLNIITLAYLYKDK
jgi:hypothetical protein